MPHEIACVALLPPSDPMEKSDVAAVGLWSDITVRVVSLPGLKELAMEPLGGGNGHASLFGSLSCAVLRGT
jgi:DNA damage-binding protein 1